MVRNLYFCITWLFALGLFGSHSSVAHAQGHIWRPDRGTGINGYNPVAGYYGGGYGGYYGGGGGGESRFALNNGGRGGYGGGRSGYHPAAAADYGAPGYVRPSGQNTGYNWVYSTADGPAGRVDHPVNWGNYARIGSFDYNAYPNYANYDYRGYQGGGEVATVDSYPRILWNYLTNSQTHYKNWSAYPDRGAAGQGSGPHGSEIKIYGNRNAMRNVDAPDNQSLIVLESMGQDAEDIKAINVMFRVVGYYPEHNDWYWVQYDKNGKVSRLPSADNNARMAGRVQSCIRCHSQADDGDYVVSND